MTDGRHWIGVIGVAILGACGNKAVSTPTGTAGLGGGGSALGGGASDRTPTGASGGRPVGVESGGQATQPAFGGGSATGGSSTSSQGGSGGGSGSANPLPQSQGMCAALQLEENVNIGSYNTDRFTWNDAQCLPRQAAMVRAGAGYVRQFSYQVDGKTRTATGTGVNGHNGWGYTVNHGLPNSGIVAGKAGAFKPVFVGAHHALYEYKFDVDNQLPVTQHWLFATGRSNPVLATTYDMQARAKGINADTRTPYGDMAWDGDENAATTVVSGVGWGDRYKFTTTKAPLTMDSTWNYAEPNLVPYVLLWADASDAEMGAVQTETYMRKDAGGYWFYSNWGKTSENQAKADGQIGNMPATWNWTYQINQYELCIENPTCLNGTTGSHRLAWGSNYGAIGGVGAAGTYPAYGDDKSLSGWPYQSYSVFMVLGKHSERKVLSQVEEIETVQKTRLNASVGQVKAMLPGGVGRTDVVVADPPGYDARYSTWNVEAAGNKAVVTVSMAAGSLHMPVLVVSGFDGPSMPAISVDGVAQAQDVQVLASLVPTRKELWITFRPGWSGTHEIRIE